MSQARRDNLRVTGHHLKILDDVRVVKRQLDDEHSTVFVEVDGHRITHQWFGRDQLDVKALSHFDSSLRMGGLLGQDTRQLFGKIRLRLFLFFLVHFLLRFFFRRWQYLVERRGHSFVRTRSYPIPRVVEIIVESLRRRDVTRPAFAIADRNNR